jgi:hypothetical protein
MEIERARLFARRGRRKRGMRVWNLHHLAFGNIGDRE